MIPPPHTVCLIQRPIPHMLYIGAIGSLLSLMMLCIAWEAFLAPLRPGGSWLILKMIPLLLPLRGVLKRKLYTLQWAAMLILIYFAEGVVRATSEVGLARWLAIFEIGLSVLFFCCCIGLLRPYKKSARALQNTRT